MEANLKFNLNELEDIIAYQRCNKSTDLVLALWNFRNSINDIIDNEEEKEPAEKIRNKFFEILDEYNIILDELCY